MNGAPRAAFFPRLVRLARKELSESLRDRRTIITLLLMPILLYPLLTIALGQFLVSPDPATAEPDKLVIGFATKEEEELVTAQIKAGEDVLRGRPAPQKVSSEAKASESAPPPILFTGVFGDELEWKVRTGEVHLGVRVQDLKEERWRVGADRAFYCDLLYVQDSLQGIQTKALVERRLAAANDGGLFARLGARLPPRFDPQGRLVPGLPIVQLSPLPAPLKPAKDSSGLPLSTLLPLVLVLMTMTGAVYPAIDLTAGERERGTLEILVAAPIPRLSVLLAKYVAVVTVAMLTALVNVGMMTLTLSATDVGKLIPGGGLSLVALVQIFLLLLLFAGFFSAVLLALTSFARSFKEAQAYIVPLMLLCLTPGVLALMPGLSLNGPLAVVPLVNIVLLSKEVFEGTASVGAAGVVVVVTILYALAAIALAARIFGTEAVLTGTPGSWGDLFRRPTKSRSAPALAGALLCLALMFPVSFLVNAGAGQLEELSLGAKLTLSAMVSVVLFVGFPLATAWLGHVEPRPAFRLWPAGAAGFAIAAVLGLSLWPFAHEVILLLRQAGVSTLRPEVRKKIPELMEQWRSYSPVLLVLVMAVVPAVTEELFFRGYLFGAFKGETGKAWPTILGTAGLFAVFHLLMGGSLVVERLPPSFLLGVVLGWLAWTTGSVLPGMLLHVLHNGFLVLLGYYAPQLEARDLVPSADDHLPLAWLGTAALVAGLALVGLWAIGRTGQQIHGAETRA